jgi:hypothetical protein
MATARGFLWMKDDPLGMEHATVSIGDGGLEATSTAFGRIRSRTASTSSSESTPIG